jgi:hypothetical protein
VEGVLCGMVYAVCKRFVNRNYKVNPQRCDWARVSGKHVWRGSRPRVLVATGTSCHEQLAPGPKRPIFYPTELLAASLPQLDG